ncbi:MAG: hypothetical protein JWM81_566 [Candidatus Saccharibacteria bacterium]|nr:hypothetical protein [Candidatus Saccharibacteria bacterium]
MTKRFDISPEQMDLLGVDTTVVHSADGIPFTSHELTDAATQPQPESVVPVEPTDETIAVDVVMRAKHLVAALDLLAGASMRGGFAAFEKTETGKREIVERYGAHWAESVTAGAAFNKSSMLRNLRYEYAAAHGGVNPQEIKETNPADLEPDFKRDFVNFYERFKGAKNSRARNNFKKFLNTTIKEVAELTPLVIESVEPPHEDELKELTSQEKLRALRDAEGLGFLPASNMEKNSSIEMDDYLKKYGALGVHTRLMEVHDSFLKRAKSKRVVMDEQAEQGQTFTPEEIRAASHSTAIEAGNKAMKSIVETYADFYLSAVTDHDNLVRLQDALDDFPNQRITLAEIEEIDTRHPGYATLRRYVDGVMVRDKSTGSTTVDPFRSKLDRDTPIEQNPDIPGHTKNKTVTNAYSQDELSEEIRARIDAFVANATKNDVMGLLEESIQSEANRIRFWGESVLPTVRGNTRSIAQAALAKEKAAAS